MPEIRLNRAKYKYMAAETEVIEMKTEVWAHRGASGYAPENTLESFALAAKMHADGVELDVQLTKDGEIVVIHDETTERVSGKPGWVKDYSLAELKELNVNLSHPEYETVRIPTLREVYELLKPTGLKINVELKTGIVFYEGLDKKVLDLTKEMGMEDRVWYSSFNHYTVKHLKELDPTVKTGILYADGIYEPEKYAAQLKADALHPALYNVQFPHIVEDCHNAGLRMHVWTVNEPDHIRLCLAAGVDSIITNYPDVVSTIISD